MITEEDVKSALKTVKYPGYTRDIISFGLVKHIAVQSNAVSVTLNLTSPNPDVARQLKADSEATIKALPGVSAVYVEVNQPAPSGAAPSQATWAQQPKVPGIKRIIAIAS